MLDRMSDEEFEQLVAAGIDAIPEKFLKKLENVAIVIADEPSTDQRKKMHLRGPNELLGLYEGIPLTECGESYGGLVLPDKITIFKSATLLLAGDDPTKADEGGSPEASGVFRERIRAVVRDTVWHEIAHFFGYDDEEVHEREAAGTNHFRKNEESKLPPKHVRPRH